MNLIKNITRRLAQPERKIISGMEEKSVDIGHSITNKEKKSTLEWQWCPRILGDGQEIKTGKGKIKGPDRNTVQKNCSRKISKPRETVIQT